MLSQLRTLALSMLLLVACSGGNLRPGASTLADVQQAWGEPALRWQDADGTTRLAYPRAPEGTQTFVARVDTSGTLLSIENVLDMDHFGAIQPGMDKEQVLRLLGPPHPQGTIHFESRNELAWEWRYCDVWNSTARFVVLFNAAQGTVLSTLNLAETCIFGECLCGH
ncbi:MAG: outer membrane protein assembly factor BamE [Rhodocyclales bacterium]|nr:outer membrane protein assembly factor BamE [Rhodocyclales bacterium]